MDNSTEPIADEELLYRRVPTSTGWYDPASRVLNPQAFAPHASNDVTGLSVSRAKYKSLEQAAGGRPGKLYFVAILRAGDLRSRGIEVVPRPVDGDPGHAELPDLNSDNKKTNETIERQEILTELCRAVEGPFGPSA